MRETTLSMPVLSLVAGTRAMLGAGLALLLGERMSRSQRKAAGWSLFLVGALTTIPLLAEALRKSRVIEKGK
ncbi:MAG: hypothetical protein P8Z70_04920 [Desulfuromonadales bacterium]|jgi:hypothetical protein